MRRVLSTKWIKKVIGLLCVVLFLSESMPVMGKTVRVHGKIEAYSCTEFDITVHRHDLNGVRHRIGKLYNVQLVQINKCTYSYVFEVEVSEPTIYDITIIPRQTTQEQPKRPTTAIQREFANRDFFPILIEPSDSSDIELNLEYFIFDCGLNGIIMLDAGKEYVKGSKNMKDYRSLIGEIDATRLIHQAELKAASRRADSIFTDYSNVDESFREDMWYIKGVREAKLKEIQDSLSEKYYSWEMYNIQYQKKYLLEHKNSLLSAYILACMEDNPNLYLNEIDQMLDGLKKKFPNNYCVKKLEQIASTDASEANVPEFQGFDKNGKKRDLSSLRGKLVLVEVCASWCKQCRFDPRLSYLNELYRKYQDKGFEIYTYSVEKSKEDWSTDGRTWDNQVYHIGIMQDAETDKLVEGGLFPRYVLVDRKGRTIISGQDIKYFEAAIDWYLAWYPNE